MTALRLSRLLSLRTVRRHPVRSLLACLAVAAGTSLTVGVLAVRASTHESISDFGRDLAGPAELRVVGAVRRGGLEVDIVDRIAATDGVDAAVPVVQAVAIVTPAGRGDNALSSDVAGGNASVDEELPVLVLGIDCRAEALVGSFGCTDGMVDDNGDRPLALGSGVDPGSVLRTNVGTVALTGVPSFPGLSDLGDGRFVVYALPTAQRLFERDGRVDVVYVEPSAAADAGAVRTGLEGVIGAHNAVLDATQPPAEVTSALADILPLFSLLALFALGVGAMLVYNAVTLSVEERRHQLAVVGALGGTRRTLTVSALAEAGVLGTVGGVGGGVGGAFVAIPIVGSLSSYTERIAGIPLELHVGLGSLALGTALGLVVSLGAALPAIRRAVRVDTVSELSGRDLRAEASIPRRLGRLLAWGSVTAVGLGLVWLGQRDGGLARWQYSAAGVGFGLAALAMLLFIASLAPLAIRPLRGVVRQSVAGRLAVANLVRSPGRTGVMVAAVAAAATTAFVTSSFLGGVRTSISDNVGTNMDGVEVSTTRRGSTVNLDGALPPETLASLAELPGVADVRRGAVILAGSTPGELMVVAGFQDAWFMRDGARVVRGSIDSAGLERGEVVLSASLARNTGLRPGDLLALPTPGGMVDVPVQAISRGAGTGEGRVTMSYDRHVDLYGPQPARTVTVVPAPGVSFDQLAERIQAADVGTEVHVRVPAEVVDEVMRSVEDQVLPLWTLQRGLLTVSFVAVLSTLLLIGMQRRRELAMLAAVGTTPSTLARMVLAEAATVGLAAVGLGSIGGLVLLWALVEAAPVLTGFAVPFRPDWAAILLWGGVSLLVALLAALWPSRRAARTEVVVALHHE